MKFIIIVALALLTAQYAFSQAPKGFFDGVSTPSYARSGSQKAINGLDDLMPSDESSGRKSIPLGILYSLMLPGMGELYAGNYGLGKYFTIAEGSLWLGYAGYYSYGNWVQTDGRNFAVQHAGISVDNKSDQYFIDIGNFDNTNQYNTEILRERNQYKTYDPNSPSAWNWDTDAHREQYRELRVSSDNMFNNSRFVLAAVVANHIISAIDAARMVISHNKNSEADLYHINAKLLGDVRNPDGIMVSLTRNF